MTLLPLLQEGPGTDLSIFVTKTLLVTQTYVKPNSILNF